jgi:hypothetical protein
MTDAIFYFGVACGLAGLTLLYVGFRRAGWL